jgi:hypothetical protein
MSDNEDDEVPWCIDDACCELCAGRECICNGGNKVLSRFDHKIVKFETEMLRLGQLTNKQNGV